VVTEPYTHTQTYTHPQTGPTTIDYTAASARCNEEITVVFGTAHTCIKETVNCVRHGWLIE